MAVLTANERLRKYIDDYGGGNVSQIEAKLSKSNGYIKNTKSYSVDVLNMLAGIFPDLNMNWLITGKGAMHISLTKTPQPAEASQGVKLSDNSDTVMSLLMEIKKEQEIIKSNFSATSKALKSLDGKALMGIFQGLPSAKIAALSQLLEDAGIDVDYDVQDIDAQENEQSPNASKGSLVKNK